jgi:excisionase family DNA binding protein
MSSNIRITRVCEYCGNDFIAKTTVTKCCSDKCAKMAYKARKKAEKIQASQKEVKEIKARPIEDIKAKEFLTVRDAATLLNCSRQTIYNLINSGALKAKNIKLKKTLVQRTEIDKLFKP